MAVVFSLVAYAGYTDEPNRRRDAEVLGVQVTPPPARFGGMRLQLPPELERGLTYAGLQAVDDGPCAGAFIGRQSGKCTHGPDPAPRGLNLQALPDRPPARDADTADPGAPADSGGPSTPGEVSKSIVCDGDGTSGKRVQAIYARPSDAADRYTTYASSIRKWAAVVDDAVNTSAAATGGIRHVRYVTDPSCTLVVENVVLSPSTTRSFDATIAELESKGYNRSDRMYLIWFDANEYCGIATLWPDDSSGSDNLNNSGPSYGRIDNRCWGFDASVEAHELMHMLGGVQLSAPNGGSGHCSDEFDRMCYDDGSGGPVNTVCPERDLDRLFDCNHDDYFNAKPLPGTYLATHWNAARNGFLIASDLVEGTFTALEPARILDTRDGTGNVPRLSGGRPADVQVTGRGGVPATGVSAVVMNVTVTGATSPGGFLSVYPAGQSPPNASNLNFVAGDTVPNLVTVKVGDGGKVSAFLNDGQAHVLFDVAGYFSDVPGSGVAGRFRALSPSRVLDTRESLGKVGPGQTIDVQVAGRGGVPSTGAAAVVLNATVTGPTTPAGFLTLFPAGSQLPLASNLNFAAGQTVANRVVVKLGDGGKVSVYNPSGTTHVILDVGGWFTAAGAPSGAPGTLVPTIPNRILDTRSGIGGSAAAVQGGQPIDVQITGRGGLPATGVSSVVLNVTVTQPTSGGGFLTVYPAGQSLPLASDVNFSAGRTVPNLVVAKVGDGGKVRVYVNDGTAHVLFDVVGYFT